MPTTAPRCAFSSTSRPSVRPLHSWSDNRDAARGPPKGLPLPSPIPVPNQQSALIRSPSQLLASLGWRTDHAASFPGGRPDLVPGRISRVDRSACEVLLEPREEPLRAPVDGPLRRLAAADPVETPSVGDWAAIRLHGPGAPLVERLLPRRTAIVRASAAGSSRGQVLAANVDVIFVVEPLVPEPDLGRIERFLTLAWASGAQPVVVLAKSDLASDAEDLVGDIASASPGADVFAVSAVTGTGLDRLASCLAGGRTGVLVGPSGAGKSSLSNALAGYDAMSTGRLRSDGKGRHTTSHRQLIVTAMGGILIDTPGLRGVGLIGDDEAVDAVFADIEELAQSCRFGDCRHVSEPGCVVLAAVEDGRLPERRLLSWRKLQREVRWMAMRNDARLRSEERARWKQIQQSVRRSGRVRP